jgi:hypothetical protein
MYYSKKRRTKASYLRRYFQLLNNLSAIEREITNDRNQFEAAKEKIGQL